LVFGLFINAMWNRDSNSERQAKNDRLTNRENIPRFDKRKWHVSRTVCPGAFLHTAARHLDWNAAQPSVQRRPGGAPDETNWFAQVSAASITEWRIELS